MNDDNAIAESELVSWITESVKKDFQKFEINLTSIPEKTGGYTGAMVYATVVGVTKENVKKEIDVIVKHGKKSEVLRKAFRTKLIFKKEIYLYENILPLYTKFQLENNVRNIFDSVPKCFKTMIFDNMEVIVMENLKSKGYELYDRRKPLNLHHIKLLLREYGKFHAISFAFRDSSNEEFNKLLDNYEDLLKLFFREEGFRENMRKSVATACNILEKAGELELLKKYKEIQEKGADVLILEILDIVEPQSAVLHGDCWNNNFLFGYQAEDQSTPTKVAILDWQVSKLHSPVLDLSNFLYIVSSGEELKHFDELLEIYHDSFSNFLYQLGSEPDQLFPFSDLQRHWKKYSLYGVLLATLYLPLTICDPGEVPDLNDLKDGDSVADIFTIQIEDQEALKERLTAVINHYYKYNF